MRIAPIALVAACAAALAIVWFVEAGSRREQPPTPAPKVASPSSDATKSADVMTPVADEPADARAAQRETAPVEAAPTSSTSSHAPRAHVFGKLVDEERKPAADVDVQLTSNTDTWTEGETVPRMQVRRWKMAGFKAQTSAEGRFDFDVPVPTSDWISLGIQPPPYLALVGLEFGPAGGRNKPRLVAGDNDLGDIVLTITGAVSGDVRAVDGTGIAKAQVSLDGVFPGGRSVNTECDDAGHFLLGHVPPGTWTFGAKAEGWLSTSMPAIEVRARNTTPIEAFRLERAPTISGRVVDEDGKPLEKMWIWGWPRSSGQGAGGTSKADGSFVIYLPQNEAYTLELEERSNKGRFEPWGGFGGDKVFEPGTNNVLVTLVRAEHTTFVVVDAGTSKPIEDYAIDVVNRPDPNGNVVHSDRSQNEKAAHHQKGESALTADPKRHRVQVVAAGYEDLEVDVAHDLGSDARQTLRMNPGASFTGRVTHAGAPVANPKLALDRDSFKLDPSKPDEEDPTFDENYTTDLSDFLGRTRNSSGSADGKFRIVDLPAGTYQLTIVGGSGAPKVVHGLRLEARATRDLGEIVLDDAGAVHGRVAFGPGQEQFEVDLQLDADWGKRVQPEGPDHTFALENLSVGDHTLHASVRSTTYMDEVVTPFVVASGKTTEIVVDLAAKAPCKARIRVTRHGQPQRGVDIGWQTVVAGEAAATGNLSTTGADGVATGTLPGGTDAVFLAKSDNGLVIGRSPAPVHLAPAAVHEADIAIESGEIVIEFPASMEIPADGMLNVMLSSGEEFQSLLLCTPKSRFQMNKLQWIGRHCPIGAVTPGEYEIMISPQSNGEASAEKLAETPHEPFRSKVTVKADQTVTIEFKP